MPSMIDDESGCAGFIHLADELARATCAADVHSAVTTWVTEAFGATLAVMAERAPARSGDYHAFTPVPGAAGVGLAPFRMIWPMSGVGRVCRADAGPATPYRPLLSAFAPLDPCCVAHVPVGSSAVLVMAWAESGPAFTSAQWRQVESAARQAGAALERVDSLRRVRELSLQDPETGVGNRRLLEIVLAHSFAQAQRGEPMTIVSILPGAGDGTPRAASDHRIADLLQRQVRGADVVARIEEGVFVVVLQSASAEGAGVFLRRVMAAAGDTHMRFALAEHDARYDDSRAMLHSVLAQVGASHSLH